MALITAGAVISRAQTMLQDTASAFGTADTGVRWTQAELLGWLNDGQREVVVLRPSASVKNTTFTLAAGTKQALPADGVMLIDVIRNLSPNTDAIRICSREVLDAQQPTWHNDTNSLTKIKHYIYDPRDPKNFYVFPKATASWTLEISYAAAPTDCANAAAVIGIDDIYSNALVDYILYRAYSKDAEYAQNAQLAMARYAAFQSSLGVKTQNELAQNPNMTAGPFNPNVAGSARV